MELPYAEPYKIKMVEQIKRSTKEQRLKIVFEIIQVPHHRLFIEFLPWITDRIIQSFISENLE